MGKTILQAPYMSWLWKHPHMHGEDLLLPLLYHVSMETPPHAWGRRNYFCVTVKRVRNTPTCMGKTGTLILDKKYHKKHPHMHGEDFAITFV